MHYKNVAWSAFYNAGQNYISPVYVKVQERFKEALITKLKKYISKFFSPNPKESPDYARIINQKHIQRLQKLMVGADIVFGGTVDEQARYIAPTILDNVSLSDSIMQEELFGPLLPILTYTKIDDALAIINKLPKPLALYVFSNDRCTQQKIMAQTNSGGVGINDVLVQGLRYTCHLVA